MQIKQYYLGCLSHASYMVTDEKSKTAVVVDPQRDIDHYLQDADQAGVKISDVILTHFHADFVAGHLELKEKTGASIHLGHKAAPGYDFIPHRQGDSLVFGDTQLKFLETPGHTPEAVSLVAYDLGHDSQKPLAVMTGDALFAGDVGRPDLAVANGQSPQDLASQLFDSLQQNLMKLPDETVVYPAHGPGSNCGSGNLKDKVSTIGQERSHNPLLQLLDRASFVEALTSQLPQAPVYFAHDAAMNQVEHPTLSELLKLQNRPLGRQEIADLVGQGATVLDVRHPDEFARGHYRGSLNVGLDGRFAEWAASLVPLDKPVVVVSSQGREEEALTRLGRVGVEQVAGTMKGGIQEIADCPDLLAKQARIQPRQLAERMEQGWAPVIIDVRTAKEYSQGHLPGARNLPLQELRQRLNEIPREGPLVIQCQSGYRSSMATSLIAARPGVANQEMVDMEGGYLAWVAAGLPISQAL